MSYKGAGLLLSDQTNETQKEDGYQLPLLHLPGSNSESYRDIRQLLKYSEKEGNTYLRICRRDFSI